MLAQTFDCTQMVNTYQPPQKMNNMRQDKLRLLTLNLFLRPIGISSTEVGNDYKQERLEYFCKHYLEDYDVICL